MSFAAIRNTALTSLMATQVRMQVTSSNIANANVEGYTRKFVTQQALIGGGMAMGVQVTGVTSSVNQFLVKDLSQAFTALSAATNYEQYSHDLQTLFGAISGGKDGKGTSLAAAISTLDDALNMLAVTPESDTLKAKVANDLESVTVMLRETSTQIQKMRANADGEIEVATGIINAKLGSIHDLNKQIMAAEALQQPTADLQDLRNQAMKELSEQMDVSYYIADTGEMRINTIGGTPLLDSAVHEVSYKSKAVVASGTGFNAITVEGVAITDHIHSGKIGAMIDMRDGMLVDAQDELNNLAQNMMSTLNASYNDSTAIPAPQSLVGMANPPQTGSFIGAGTLRIAMLDAKGVATANPVDIDLSTLPAPATIADVVALINTSAPGVASISSTGQLVLSAPAGQGIAVTSLAGATLTDPANGKSRGFSDFFGLNNLLVGDAAGNIRVRPDILAAPNLLSNSKVSTAAFVMGEKAYVMSASFLQDLANLFGKAQTFPASGALGAISTTFSDYAANIVAHVATNASHAELTFYTRQTGFESLANAMAAQTGVNIDEETGQLETLKQAFATASQILEVLNNMFEALLQAAKSA